MKKLSEILTEDTIKIPLNGNVREDAIKELIEVLSTRVIFDDKDTIYKAVMERERIMTTGVGNSIAIPHCKHESLTEFRMALGISDEEIDFMSVDQKPVRIVFLLVGPNNAAGMHIKLLSKITRLLSKVEIREKIISSKSSKDVYQLILDEESKFVE